MFLKHKNNKIINTDNVSNIFVDTNNDGSGKIIFNMNYSVKIFGDKFTPDYVYWIFDNIEDLNTIKSSLERIFIKTETWIFPAESNQRYVNLNCVSSIAIDDFKNRIIFNLNYNISHPKNHNQLTSDFVFMDFSTKDKFNDYLKSKSFDF